MQGVNLAVQSLIIASLLFGAGSNAASAQDRWPPWQSYGEAETARKPHLKARPKADEQKAAPVQPTEQKTSAPPQPNAAAQTEQLPSKPAAVLEQPQRTLTTPSAAKQTGQPTPPAGAPEATVARTAAQSAPREMKPRIEIVPQIGHSSLITSAIAFSPNGTLVLSGGPDMTVKLWDAGTGALLRTFVGHTGPVESVAFSPDGTRILSGGEDKTVKLWDASTGELLRTFEGHSEAVASVAFSLDGTRVLSGSADKTAKLWDASTGELLRTFEGQSGEVSSVAFSPDNRVLSGSGDSIRVWDAGTGALLHAFEGHGRANNSVSFSADGARLLAGSGDSGIMRDTTNDDNTIKLWDVATGQLLRTFEGHGRGVTAVASSPDGTRVLSGSYDDTIKLWDAATGALLRTFEGHDVSVSSVAFSPDGTRVLSASWDNTLKLWDAGTGQLLHTFEGHTSWVLSVAFSPNGTRMLSGGEDKTLKLWDATSGALLRTFVGHADAVTTIAFSPDATRVLSGSALGEGLDGTLRLWDANTGALLRTFKPYGGGVTAAAFSPDGTRVLSVSSDTMQLWDADTGALLRSFKAYSGASGVASAVFSRDGTRVLSGGDTIRLWDASTGALLRTFKADSDPVDPEAAATAKLYREMRELADGTPGVNSVEEAKGDGQRAGVASVAYSPDGTRVLSGGMTIRLWDASTGALLRTFEGPTSDIASVAFSPDGTRVLSGSADKKVRVWDAATGALLRTLEGHTGPVTSVAFSPDGARVLSGSVDTTVKMWSLQTGEPLASMIGGRDGEWLTITPKGFFAASRNGTAMLEVVRIFEPFSVMQIYDHLFRPDLVEQLLKGDPEGKYTDAASKLNLEKVLDSGSAPQIDQLPEHKTEMINDTAKVAVRLTDTGGGIGDKVVWRINGVTQGELSVSEPQTPKTSTGYRIVRQTFRLDPSKKNTIEITAYNGAGLLATEPYRIEIDKFGVTTEERPHMYVVAVGVSDYAKSEWHLKYAANDAQTLADTLKSVARGLYGEPKVIPVLNKDATAKGIEGAIDGLQSEVKPSDVFVLYVAGHGRSIGGTYYFLPQDLQFEGGQTVMSGGISQDMLQKWLAKIPAQKSILILDTCESAAARGGDTEQETAIDRLQHATGRSVITAASSSAFEGYQGHGLLTYTILDELTKSEGSGNEEVTLSKLAAYVYDQVPAISQRVFGERQQPHNTIADDFPLGERVVAVTNAAAIGQDDVPKSPTHVLIRAEQVREQPSSNAQAGRSLAAGTQVRVVQLLNGWAVIAREGEKLGYVPEEALLRLQ